MLLKYSLVFLAVFGVLTFLKFVENSPVRSWKTVIFTALPLGFVICYYVSCVTPQPPPPKPETQKISAYRAELERTIRRIEGVDQASIHGTRIDMNFAAE